MIDIDVSVSDSAAVDRSGSDAVLDTSELRWFALGRPPRDVMAWFSAACTAGNVEHRCDIYRVNGRHDAGLKHRFGRIPEVKVRRAVGPTITLEAGLEASLEEWRKWTATDGDPELPGPNARWIEIDKTVLTRTFTPSGREVAGPASHADGTFSGCDVEIAAVTVGALETWTFAFEAFGAKADRRRAVLSSWETLVAQSHVPEHLGERFDRAAGYPEWLDLVAV
jgi:hypothetical protein